MTSFEQRINAIEQEITALKSISRKSSTIIATTSQDATVTAQIKGITFPGGGKSAKASLAGIIELNLSQPGFSSISIATDATAAGRTLTVEPYGTTDGKPGARIYCSEASAADITALNGSGTMDIPIVAHITATCQFTATVSQEAI